MKKIQKDKLALRARLCFDFDYVVIFVLGCFVGFAFGFFIGISSQMIELILLGVIFILIAMYLDERQQNRSKKK